jgi:uncharacterized protein YcbX
MDAVGTVESLWRYPVKSMRGELLESASVGSGGILGDRLYAIHDDAAPAHFPYLTARQREAMLLMKPRFSGDAPAPGHPPAEGSPALVRVELPDGRVLSLEDPSLLELLAQGLPKRHQLRIMYSQRAITDSRPISLFSLQTVRQLSREIQMALDKRRFRANIYLDLPEYRGFGENALIGRTLQIGDQAVVSVVERDSRCKLINLDPDSSIGSPRIMKHLARHYRGEAGLYATVLTEGTVRPGDPVVLI